MPSATDDVACDNVLKKRWDWLSPADEKYECSAQQNAIASLASVLLWILLRRRADSSRIARSFTKHCSRSAVRPHISLRDLSKSNFSESETTEGNFSNFAQCHLVVLVLVHKYQQLVEDNGGDAAE